MQFMIKKLYVTNEIAFDDAQVKSSSDLAYVIHKKLQNFGYLEAISSSVYLTEVYTRPNDDSDWVLAFTSANREPEDEPLENYKAPFLIEKNKTEYEDVW